MGKNGVSNVFVRNATAVVVFAALIALCLCAMGCAGGSGQSESSKQASAGSLMDGRMQVIDEFDDGTVIYKDYETEIIYMARDGSSTLSPLYTGLGNVMRGSDYQQSKESYESTASDGHPYDPETESQYLQHVDDGSGSVDSADQGSDEGSDEAADSSANANEGALGAFDIDSRMLLKDSGDSAASEGGER